MNLPVPLPAKKTPVWNEIQLAVLRVIHYSEHAAMAEKYAIIRRLEWEEGVLVDGEADFYNCIMLLTMGGMVKPKAFRMTARGGKKWRVWAYVLTPKAKLVLRYDARLRVAPSAQAG